ncbi:MAG: hypothetical protein IGQ45_06185 [Cyanobacterium sp. T60_A2020_053]|nr:hypothetical protein [Cyanobacterium sp. T60_A2020_053]
MNNKKQKKCQSLETFHQSLAKKTLIKTVLAVGIITLLCNGLGYLYVIRRIKDDTIQTVKKNTEIVVEKESEIFIQAENNNNLVKQYLQNQINTIDP